VGKGDFVVMAVWWTDVFDHFSQMVNNGTGYELQDDERTVFLGLQVLDVFEGTLGKWDDSYSNGEKLVFCFVLFCFCFCFCFSELPY